MGELDELKVEVSRLRDRAAISDVLYRYAGAIDARDWRLFETLFTEDATIDYTSSSYASRAALMAGLPRAIEAFFATHHMSTNHRIEIDGDRARSISYMHALHVRDAAQMHEHLDYGGWYLHDFVRTPDGWRIARLRLRRVWSDGVAPRGDAPTSRSGIDEMRDHLGRS